MTNLKLFFAGAAGVLALTSSAASAQSNATSDVRCLLMSNYALAAAKEEKAKELASSSQLFYLGRVSGHSQTKVQSAVRSFPKQISSAAAGQMMNDCARLVQTSAQNVEAIIRATAR